MDSTDCVTCATPFVVTILAFTIGHRNAQFPEQPSQEWPALIGDGWLDGYVLHMDLAGQRPRWPIAEPEEFRTELQRWIGENWDLEITVAEWWDRLARTGLTAPTWTRSQGGLAATTAIQNVIEEELAKIGAITPPVMGLGIRMVGAAIRQFATPEQFEQIIPRLLTGRNLWTALMNEPGRDDPATTTCVADFDWKYVTLNGVKTCPDLAATHAIMLARSVPGSTGRDGLSWLIVELGYQPIDHANGTATFHDVRLLHDRVLGTRDDGWAIAKTILPFNERSFAGRIRRGLVHVQGGDTAGNLHRVVGNVLAEARARAQARASAPDAVDRRRS